MAEKLDLKRMQRLLNGLNNDSSSFNKIDSDVFRISDTDCFNSNSNDINIDQADMCRALSFKGNIKGYTNISPVDTLFDDIVLNLGIDNIKNCKSMIVTYTVNPDVSFFGIGDIMKNLNDMVNDDCEMVFGTQTSLDLHKEVVEYKILLTGIDSKRTKDISINSNFDSDIKYKELFEENKLLKDQNERMKLSLLSLKKE